MFKIVGSPADLSVSYSNVPHLIGHPVVVAGADLRRDALALVEVVALRALAARRAVRRALGRVLVTVLVPAGGTAHRPALAGKG